MTAQEAGTFMRAFGDGTRLRILAALAIRPATVWELARQIRCPEHRVSRHLRYLHARGVVEWSPAGKAVSYRLAAPSHPLHAQVLAAVRATMGDIEEVRADSAQLRKGRKR
jgi:ArsR family transcriptional regulator